MWIVDDLCRGCRPCRRSINMKQNKIELQKKKSIVNIASGFHNQIDPDKAIDNALKELHNSKGNEFSFENNPNLFKIFSTLEFDKGTFLTLAFPVTYQSFALDFSRNLQLEYVCKTPSEKSLAELIAFNYCRVLHTQSRIQNYLNLGKVSDIGTKYLDFLSRELDRANRHFLTALQTIKTMKQPNIEVNVKTQTTVIGQNQIVQNNNK